jgi:hypothetical protein
MRSAGSFKAVAVLRARRMANEAMAAVLGDDAIEEALETTVSAIRALPEERATEALKADIDAAVGTLKSELGKARVDTRRDV